jgi:hypothetical protein
MSAAAVMNGTDARVHDGYSFRAANPIDPKLLARITAALGYDPIEAATLPEQAHIGEGCGTPLLMSKVLSSRRLPVSLLTATRAKLWLI